MGFQGLQRTYKYLLVQEIPFEPPTYVALSEKSGLIKKRMLEIFEEARDNGWIDRDFADVALKGITSGEIKVEYGSFSDTYFVDRFPALKGSSRETLSMLTARYDSEMGAIVFNSDHESNRNLYSSEFAETVVHETRHYYHKKINFAGSLPAEETDAEITGSAYSLQSTGGIKHDDKLQELLGRSRGEADILHTRLTDQLTSLFKMKLSEKFQKWLRERSYNPNVEVEIAAWYKLKEPAQYSVQEKRFTNSYLSGRIWMSMFTCFNQYLPVHSKFGNYNASLFSQKPASQNCHFGESIDLDAGQVNQCAHTPLDSVNWDNRFEESRIKGAKTLYLFYLVDNRPGEVESYFMDEYWAAFYRPLVE